MFTNQVDMKPQIHYYYSIRYAKHPRIYILYNIYRSNVSNVGTERGKPCTL